MRKISYLFAVAVVTFLASCMNKDWDTPVSPLDTPVGNNTITERNVITVAQLKAMFPNLLQNNGYAYKEITDDVQLKVRVTGTDDGSNIYKQFCVQDATGGIIISVNQNGLHGIMPTGSLLLIDLKGLTYGGYAGQPQIGVPFKDDEGRLNVGRMDKYLWNQHFRIIGAADETVFPPVEFSSIVNDLNNCGQLVTIPVTFRDTTMMFAPDYDMVTADGTVGKYTYLGDAHNYVHHEGEVMGKKVIIRTSTYAHFASYKLPAKCRLTGIATRYDSDWQLLIRRPSDIEIIDN